MFRTFFRRAFENNSSKNAALQFARFNSTLQTRTRAKEMRDVKLIGTIYQDPLTLKDGGKLITVRTFQPDGYYKVHRALITSNSKILEFVGNNLTIGQRVFLSGQLRSTNFMNNENQNRQMFQVHVNELYASKSNESDVNSNEGEKSIDHNSVFVLAHIASDIKHFENHSRFFVTSHFTTRNPVEGENEKTLFFAIYVHDRNLRNLLENNFQKRDRVFISGLLSNKPETDQNGQKRLSGHIEATDIIKIGRSFEADDENTIEENVKTAIE